ncbi:hypothetical protein [Acinetobacter sp.]|uniref:hypothetical protein n=1 Tax=Acinetobacter sp. TaxID=472 RepID=UPI003CFDAA6A
MTREELKKMSNEEYAEFLQKRAMKDGLEIMDELGYKNTPLGQATNITPVDDFRERGLACSFEHCIQQLPFVPQELTAFHPAWQYVRCLAFSRACPGGPIQVLNCFGKPDEANIAQKEPEVSAPAETKVSKKPEKTK